MLVDSDAELPVSIAAKRFEVVAWEKREALPADGIKENLESLLRLLKAWNSFTRSPAANRCVRISRNLEGGERSIRH